MKICIDERTYEGSATEIMEQWRVELKHRHSTVPR